MARDCEIEVLADICGQEWFLNIGFSYTGGHSGSAPSLSDPGEPAEGPEIEVKSISWAKAIQPLPRYIDGKRNPAKAKPGPVWYKISGPLFDLLADDEWLREKMEEAAESHEREDY